MAQPGESTLPDTLGTLPERVGKFVTPASVEQRGAAARREVPALMKERREAQAGQEMREFERDQDVIRKTVEAERDVILDKEKSALALSSFYEE